jgi:hypothetical protein
MSNASLGGWCRGRHRGGEAVRRSPEPWIGAGSRSYLRGGFFIVKSSEQIPCSTWRQLTRAATGNPARGDQAPMAVVPRPLRN